ncbi:hypothetical protein GGR54DRAFT_601856 [Hypoxylon sp. NC1633]|nr:hypothetical protein GGR54DRAFT_601856 [Hypoxylon sp. NC1633]
MANLNPDIFQEFQQRHFRCSPKFRSANIHAIEAEGFECGIPTLRTSIVTPGELEGWLEKVTVQNQQPGLHLGSTDKNGQRRPKLRVIVGYLGKGQKYDYMMHGQELTPADLHPPLIALPFSRENYEHMCKKLQLPTITTSLLVRNTRPLRGHFQVTRTSSNDLDPVYGMTLSTFSSLLIGVKLGVCISYSPSEGVVNALVLGSGVPEGLAWLQQDLEQLVTLADNPFLIPTLICQRLVEAIYACIDDNFERLHHIEHGSGQTGIMLFGDNGMPVPRGNCEDPNLSIAILGVAQRALAVEAYVRSNILTVRSVKSELLAFPWQQFASLDYERVLAQNELITKQLDFISRTMELALIRVEHLIQRANVQTTAITNLLAQRNNESNRKLAESSTSIARDTRRDSSAMKSIAILTMVFLPATFTATYFGTPAIAALEPSQNLYWIVTLPLTVAVLLVWLLTLRFCLSKGGTWFNW